MQEQIACMLCMRISKHVMAVWQGIWINWRRRGGEGDIVYQRKKLRRASIVNREIMWHKVKVAVTEGVEFMQMPTIHQPFIKFLWLLTEKQTNRFLGWLVFTRPLYANDTILST